MSMVIAGKIFKIAESVSFSEIASKLKDFKVEEDYEEGDFKFTLVTEIMNLNAAENLVTGVYSHDYVLRVFHRGRTVPLPKTIEAIFNFSQLKKQLLLTVVEKKRIANFIANKLSEITL